MYLPCFGLEVVGGMSEAVDRTVVPSGFVPAIEVGLTVVAVAISVVTGVDAEWRAERTEVLAVAGIVE